MIDWSTINQSNPADVQIQHGTLSGDFGVCSDERFASQPTAANCSATLIGPDLILTAGHCVSASNCASRAFVFDWTMTDATTLHTITSDDVYRCSQVLVGQVAASDFAVVRLDRPVVGRTPAQLGLDPVALPLHTPMIVQGYPTTIPLKIDDGGAIRDGRDATLDYFVANLDTFGGNSGSGVWTHDGRLVGILVRGESDYVQDPSGCYRVHVCPDDGCGGEESTYAFRAIQALCQVSDEPGLCDCGDGTCDPTIGEDTTTCATDCGASCGDGVCNGGETPATCGGDCGTCGNGTCDASESPDTCCDDCACSGATPVCFEHSCRPDPGPGDTCASALDIPASGTQTITGSTTLALDDYGDDCVGGGANDRVYTFTLDGPTDVDATMTGFDTGLYLESTCGDAASSIVCNDDVDTQGGDTTSHITASLDAGTYYLIADGYQGVSGDYTLTVTFTGNAGPDAGVGDDTADDTGGGGCCSTGGGGAGGSLLLAAFLVSTWRRRARSRR